MPSGNIDRRVEAVLSCFDLWTRKHQLEFTLKTRHLGLNPALIGAGDVPMCLRTGIIGQHTADQFLDRVLRQAPHARYTITVGLAEVFQQTAKNLGAGLALSDLSGGCKRSSMPAAVAAFDGRILNRTVPVLQRMGLSASQIDAIL